MRPLPRFDHILQALATGWVLSACTSPMPRQETGGDTEVAGQATREPVAARPSSAGPAPGSTVRYDESPDDAIRAASVASPYRITAQAAEGTIRYRIAMRDGVAWQWPETGEQHVGQDGDTVVLTICKACGQEAPPAADALQGDLQPNHWVDNRDLTIRTFAREVRGGSVDRSMRLLVNEVQQRMNGPIDYGRYLTSREAYEARQGDCTEAALLLAAAAKAHHIPARVAFGMAYASRFLGQKRVFGPHMWVQAWNGTRWTSYDAGLGQFDSTHIVLAVGDGRPDDVPQVFAKLRDVRIVSAEGVLPAVAGLH